MDAHFRGHDILRAKLRHHQRLGKRKVSKFRQLSDTFLIYFVKLSIYHHLVDKVSDSYE